MLDLKKSSYFMCCFKSAVCKLCPLNLTKTWAVLIVKQVQIFQWKNDQPRRQIVYVSAYDDYVHCPCVRVQTGKRWRRGLKVWTLQYSISKCDLCRWSQKSLFSRSESAPCKRPCVTHSNTHTPTQSSRRAFLTSSPHFNTSFWRSFNLL